MECKFQIRALAVERFAPLFAMSGAELAARGVRRCVADAKPGFPCRVSLKDAEVGERVLLLSFLHQDADSPYRACGPVFVREGAEEARPGVREVPESVRSRLLSYRAYDAMGMMVDAQVAEGAELESVVANLLADPRAAYLHLHNARPGCFSCRVDRA